MKSRPVLPPLDPLQRYTPEEAAAYLRTSRKTVFDSIRTERLKSFKEGKRRYISGTEIARASAGPTTVAA